MDYLYKAYIGLLIFQFVSSLISLILLIFVSAPYGRFYDIDNKKWGASIGVVPGWLIMEMPSFAIMILFFIFGYLHQKVNLVSLVFLLIWEFHYTQRTLIYPFLLKNKKKKMALLIPLLGAFVNLVNSYINGYWLFFSGNTRDISWLYSPYFILGLVIFTTGYGINLWADRKLRLLRPKGDTSYKIPHGGLYNFIVSPNYLGEILEWLGFAILTMSWSGLAFLFLTVSNLLPRAIKSRKWYIEHFGDEFPKERKAIFPFIL